MAIANRTIEVEIMRNALHESLYVDGVMVADSEPNFDKETSTMYGDVDLDDGRTLRIYMTWFEESRDNAGEQE